MSSLRSDPFDFTLDRLPSEERRRLVRDLLRAHAESIASGEKPEETAPLLKLVPPVESEAEFEKAAQRTRDFLRQALCRIEAEEEAAHGILEQLSPHPHERQLTMVRNLARFQTWAAVESLREASLRLGSVDPRQSLRLAELALEAAERAAERTLTPRLAHDLLASAWGQLGNALRINEEFEASARAFVAAGDQLEEGTGDPIAEARLLSLRSSLAFALGDFDEARRLGRRAIRLLRMVGQRHELGRVLIKQSANCLECGRHEEGLQHLTEARQSVDLAKEPRLAVLIHQNAALLLARLGRLLEATAEIAHARALPPGTAHPLDLVRLTWNEGHLAAIKGDLPTAERCLRDSMGAFLEFDLFADACFAGLELALVLLKRGRATEVKALAAQMVPIFSGKGIHAEAQAALQLFRAAAEREALDLAWLARLAAYFERARKRPGLRFEG